MTGRPTQPAPRGGDSPTRMETAMTTTSREAETAPTNQPDADVEPEQRPVRAVASSEPACELEAAASRPGVDPCDVACDAMPGYVIGDLAPPDQHWLLDHTGECGYCHRMLTGYERLDGVLDLLDEPVPEAVPPASCLRRHPPARYGSIESPLGPLWVAVSDEGVCEIGFGVNETEADYRHRLEARGFAPVVDAEAVAPLAAQLEEYFVGRRRRFDVPLDFAGVSPFTRSVLEATAAVPFGHLSTYRQIADRIGHPRATRAVGNALGRNPIPVIVPCHRVVRSDATPVGYTGGLGIKQRLLSLEGIAPGPAAGQTTLFDRTTAEVAAGFV